MKHTLPQYRFVQRAVTRFMPGVEAENALAAAGQLQRDNIAAVLTKLGENITSESEAGMVAAHYRELLDKIKDRNLDCHVSVKLTQLGLDLSKEICLNNLLSIVRHAKQLGNFVSVDIEQSSYVDVTIDVFRRTREEYENVGLCLQAYLYRTEKDLESLLSIPAAIRLVKGAYAEPPEIAYQRKEDVDRNYEALTRKILGSAVKSMRPSAIGTHDRTLIRKTQESIAAMKLPKQAVEFQLLFGIQREEQLRLAREGYKTRVLISYGSFWFPWYMRRLAERPANVWFVVRNIFAK